MTSRRAARTVGLSVALLLAFAVPASAQLVVLNAKPLTGEAGANLFIADSNLWSLPRVVTFEDAKDLGICSPQNYTVDVDWGEGGGWVIPVNRAKIVKTVEIGQDSCEYSAEAPGPPADAATSAGLAFNYAYKQARPFTYYVRVCRIKPATCAGDVTGTASIQYAPFRGAVLPGLSSDTAQAFSGLVALISDKNWYAGAGDFTAKINWGDGTQAPADQIVAVGGAFAVMGTHNYGSAGRLRNALLRQGEQRVPVTVTVDRPITPATRGRQARVASPQDFQGNIAVLPPQPVQALCTDGRPPAPGGGACPPEPAPPPPTPAIEVAGSHSLGAISRNGLELQLRRLPIAVQYGIIVKLRGPASCPRQGRPRPALKTLASAVLGLPPHADGADLKRTWKLSATVLGKLCPSGTYGVTVPARPPVYPQTSATVSFTR